MWWEERCVRCRNCQNECPKDAISFLHNALLIDQSGCDMCGLCVETCPSQALQVVGEEMVISQVIQEIEKDMVFYDESGGGATLSGGEPLMQPEFSQALLKSCKELKIHTTLDTCGYAQIDILSKMCEHVDLILYDLKVINDEKHVKHTGVSNRLILDNLKQLLKNGQHVLIRFPLIPGVNNNEQDIEELGVFVSSMDKVQELSILPYHKAGAEKLKRLTHSKNSFLVSHSSPIEMDEIEKRLKSYGLKIRVGA